MKLPPEDEIESYTKAPLEHGCRDYEMHTLTGPLAHHRMLPLTMPVVAVDLSAADCELTFAELDRRSDRPASPHGIDVDLTSWFARAPTSQTESFVTEQAIVEIGGMRASADDAGPFILGGAAHRLPGKAPRERLDVIEWLVPNGPRLRSVPPRDPSSYCPVRAVLAIRLRRAPGRLKRNWALPRSQ